MTPEVLVKRLNGGKPVYGYLQTLEAPPREVKVRIVETWVVGQRGLTCRENEASYFYYPYTAVRIIESKKKGK